MFVRRTSDSRPGSVFESRAADRGAGPTISILIVVPTMTTVRSQLIRRVSEQLEIDTSVSQQRDYRVAYLLKTRKFADRITFSTVPRLILGTPT